MCFAGSGLSVFSNMVISFICTPPRPFVIKTALGFPHFCDHCQVSEQLLDKDVWQPYYTLLFWTQFLIIAFCIWDLKNWTRKIFDKQVVLQAEHFGTTCCILSYHLTHWVGPLTETMQMPANLCNSYQDAKQTLFIKKSLRSKNIKGKSNHLTSAVATFCEILSIS